MKKLITLFLLSFLFINCNSARKARIATTKQGNIAAENYTQEISFDYHKNLIFVPLEINGKTYQFLFDTGNDLTAIDDEVAAEINSSSNNISGEIFDASNKSRILEHISIERLFLGRIEFQNMGAQVTDLSSLSEILGCKKIDGVIGSNFIRKAKWQIDYQNKKIRFSDKLDSLIPNNSLKGIQVIGNNWNELNFEIVLNGVSEVFLLDTGYNGFITGSNLMYDKINDLSEISQIKSKSVFFGAFSKNINEEIFGNINNMKFGDIILTNQTISFYDTKPKIGNLFLQNYQFTIDYNNRKIYLELEKPIEDNLINEFEVNFKPNYFSQSIEINRIWENGISELAIGTKLLKIDNIDVSKFNKIELCDFWKSYKMTYENTDKIIIQVLNNGLPKEIELNRKNRLSRD